MATDLAGLYRSVIQARLSLLKCDSCGHPLEHATILSATNGTTHDEHRLSESSVARLLAATQRLGVRCDHCAATREVGIRLVQAPQVPSLSGVDLTPWSPGAVAVYRSIVRARVSERACPSCQGLLGGAGVSKAMGGTTLPEHRFDDELAVSIIAWTQCLTVHCARCGTDVEF